MNAQMASMKYLILYLLCALATELSMAHASEHVKLATSRDLGLSFYAQNTDQCSYELEVSVVGPVPSFGSATYEKYQQTLGRLRAVLLDECAIANRILVFNVASEGRAQEMVRVNGWRVTEISTREKLPVCVVIRDADCDKRAKAYARLRDALLSGRIDDIEIEPQLMEQGATVQFRNIQGVRGAIIWHYANGRSVSSDEVAGQMADVFAAQCESKGGDALLDEDSARAVNIARFEVSCSGAGPDEFRSFYASVEVGDIFALTFYGRQNDADHIKEFSDRIIHALNESTP